MTQHVSVVIPVYNEEAVLPVLMARLRTALAFLKGRYTVLFVDDGSTDSSRMKLKMIASEHPNVSLVILSRNFGHQAAISAGLSLAKGDVVVVMDADLQDPPELIGAMYEKIREGFDVVYGVRRTRKGNLFKRFSYYLFYRVLDFLSYHPIPLDAGDFCVMSDRVVRLLNEMPEKDRFLRGIRSWVGFPQARLEYDRDDRFQGRSNYSIGRLIKLALDGIVSSSDKPLRLSSLLGFFISFGALLFSIFAVLWYVWGGRGKLPGYASLALGVFFLGGIQLIAIGILGEYIARIFNQLKGRPLFIVAEKINVN